jgi:hypothetical protein
MNCDLLTLFRQQDWKQAAHYYQRYITIRESESSNIDEDSGTSQTSETKTNNMAIPFHDQHDIVARLAALYQSGQFHLPCNYQKSGRILVLEENHR